ncbi:MAG: ABC transporter ATP-binding protein [Deltaproteobacteria bacterium]|nr:ABC transporter ATP-binding protein [Deltaproteobacteria bacterium]
MARAALTRVSIDRVAKTFGTTVALRAVSGTLRGGELTVIEGPNGSGKSTLLRILGTVLQPTAGQVLYEPVGDDLARVRAEVGWVSHESLTYGDLSGRANVELAAKLHGLDAAQAWRQVAERFELRAFADRPVRTLSRGQRQRIALARSLVHSPSLLLLDEPTTGLDRAGTERLLGALDERLAGGAIAVVVSHGLEALGERCRQRIVLRRGRVAQCERLPG